MTDALLHPQLRGPLLEAMALHRRAFGAEPTLAVAAPGRVNLIGEHTDYNEGLVLPLAIERWTVVVASPTELDVGAREVRCVSASAAGELRVSTEQLRRVGEAEAIAAGFERSGPRAWKRYAIGVAAGIARRAAGVASGQELPGVRMAVAGTVPLGGGLSSSASLEMSLAQMLTRVWNVALDEVGLAAVGREAEHRFAGVPCGIMDQMVIAAARAGHALQIDCRSMVLSHVPMPSANEAVVAIIDSGVRHALAGGEYAKRRAACERAAGWLGVRSLREIEESDAASVAGRVSKALGDEEAACVRHVVSETARVSHAVSALRDKDYPRVGELMKQSHASLRDDYCVSCPELDAIVEHAARVPGVFGVRMTGGGFGGSAMALIRPERERELSEAMRTAGAFVGGMAGGAADGGAVGAGAFPLFVTSATAGVHELDASVLARAARESKA